MTEWAIKNNRVTLIAVLTLFISGISAYINLPKAQDPGFLVRSVVIITQFPGASAQRVEELVTDAIEEKIQEMPEIDEIRSDSRAGISVISVDFHTYLFDMQPIYDRLRRKVAEIEPQLPTGAFKPYINDEFGDTYGHIYSIVGKDFSPKELRDAALDVREAMLKEPDVAKVEMFGDIEETIYIEYDNARLTELGLSPQQLSASLQSLNILSSGGDITLGRERLNLEPTGNFDTVNDLRDAIIELPGSRALIRLGDIARIYRDYEDPVSALVRVDGKPGISLAISLRSGGNLITLGERLAVLTQELEYELPLGMAIRPMFIQSQLTSEAVDSFLENLVQSVLIVVAVMMFSLGWRTGFVVASLIPIVMVSTFVVMAQFDIGIDRISLAALIISLGLLVDNAIVVVEAVTVRREQGENPIQAAINAAREMKAPLMISSLTTAAAFTPIALAKSEVGEFTASIFYVVTISLLISWVMAMTFIPMLTPYIKVTKKPKTSESADTFNSPFYQRYRAVLLKSVRNPVLFGLLVVGIFALAVVGMRYVPQVFIPPSEDPHLTVALTLPTGTDIEFNQQSVMALEAFMQENLWVNGDDEQAIGVTGWTAYIGTGGPRFMLAFNPQNGNESETAMIINLNNPESLDPVKAAIEDYFFENQPDMFVKVQRLANGPPVAYPIVIKVTGPDFDEINRIVETIKAKYQELEEVTAVKDQWGPQLKKFVVDIDQARAFRSGVTSTDIATSLNASLSGMQMTYFRENDERIPIVMWTKTSDRNDLTKLENLSVFSQSAGTVVPLSQVADIRIAFDHARIERINRERTNKVQVMLRDGVTATEISARMRPWLQEYATTWKSGYRYKEGGENEESDKAGKSIGAALPFAIVMIVGLLVLQFNSFRRTAIVLITIPLGLIGITFGLLVMQSIFGFFTLLGLISLAGIVINNAIVLLDRIKLEVEENGRSEADAVIISAQQRARPILLTTATTCGGMLPLMLSGGPMFEPMAISILFGLLFATFLTLLLVPVLYGVLFKVKFA